MRLVDARRGAREPAPGTACGRLGIRRGLFHRPHRGIQRAHPALEILGRLGRGGQRGGGGIVVGIAGGDVLHRGQRFYDVGAQRFQAFPGGVDRRAQRRIGPVRGCGGHGVGRIRPAGPARAAATRRGLPRKAGRCRVERLHHPVDVADKGPVRSIARLGRAPVEDVAGVDLGADAPDQRVPPVGSNGDVQIAHAGGQSPDAARARAGRVAPGNAYRVDIDRIGGRDRGDELEMRREGGGHAVERIDPAVRARVAVLAGHRTRQRLAVGRAVPGRGDVAGAIGGGEGVAGARGGGEGLLGGAQQRFGVTSATDGFSGARDCRERLPLAVTSSCASAAAAVSTTAANGNTAGSVRGQVNVRSPVA